MSIIKRAGSLLYRLVNRGGDPSSESGVVQLYGDEVAGSTRLKVMDGSGTIHDLSTTPSEYIHAELGTNQAYSSGAAIDYDTITANNGITVNSSGRFSNLRAGRVYAAFAYVFGGNTATSVIEFQWFRDPGGTPVAIGTAGKMLMVNSTTSESPQGVAVAILEVGGSDDELECRMLAGGSGAVFTGSKAIIKQIG